jgi:hypothetical protein
VDLRNLEVNQALEVVGVANEYLLPDLKFFLERYIISSDAVDKDNVFYVLEMSEHFDARELSYHCVGLIANDGDSWARSSAEIRKQLEALPDHIKQALRQRQVP